MTLDILLLDDLWKGGQQGMEQDVLCSGEALNPLLLGLDYIRKLPKKLLVCGWSIGTPDGARGKNFQLRSREKISS